MLTGRRVGQNPIPTGPNVYPHNPPQGANRTNGLGSADGLPDRQTLPGFPMDQPSFGDNVFSASLVYGRSYNPVGHPNFAREASLGALDFRFNTGHGYYRSHTGPGGVLNDFSTTSLTPDQIENAIAKDIAGHLSRGGTIPTPGPGFRGPLNRDVNVGGINVGYRVSLIHGRYRIATYFQR